MSLCSRKIIFTVQRPRSCEHGKLNKIGGSDASLNGRTTVALVPGDRSVNPVSWLHGGGVPDPATPPLSGASESTADQVKLGLNRELVLRCIRKNWPRSLAGGRHAQARVGSQSNPTSLLSSAAPASCCRSSW